MVTRQFQYYIILNRTSVVLSMIWIRSPQWDWGWMLSGLPLGFFFLFLSHWFAVAWLMIIITLIFQTGHSLSPIVLAWSHGGFREHMLRRPGKFVWAPFTIMASLMIIGYICGLYWPRPTIDPVSFTMLFDPTSPLYWIVMFFVYWNVWHFCMQHFGVMSIYRHLAGWYPQSQRLMDRIYCSVTCWLALVLSSVHSLANNLRWPILGFYPVLSLYVAVAVIGAAIMLWREWSLGRLCLPRIVLVLTSSISAGTVMLWPALGLGTILMSHWLGAIGLSSHVAKRNLWAYSPSLIVVGILIYLGLYADFHHLENLAIPTTIAATAVAFRIGMGANHFLYDRWVWKMSDPQVRATIGKDLFAAVPTMRMSSSLVTVAALDQLA